MQYTKTLTTKTGSELYLRNGDAPDGDAALAVFNKTHAETEYLLTYPDESSMTAEQEAEFLKRAVMMAAGRKACRQSLNVLNEESVRQKCADAMAAATGSNLSPLRSGYASALQSSPDMGAKSRRKRPFLRTGGAVWQHKPTLSTSPRYGSTRARAATAQ